MMKNKCFRVIEVVHLRLFGHPMGEEMRIFIGHLGISFFGGVISSVLLLFVSVIVGRILGPVDYGKYALYVALFSFFTIFLSFGLETTIVRIAAKADRGRRKRILSTFVIFFFANSIFWSLLFLLFSDFIAKIFDLPVSFIFFALLFSMTNSLGVALESFLKLLNQFVFVNSVRVLQGLFLLLSLFLLYFSFEGLFSLRWFVGLNVIVSMLVLAAFLVKTRSYIAFVFDNEVLKELFSFSSVIFLGVVSGYLIQNGTNVLIGKFIGSRELGIYNAYYTLSILATGQCMMFFSAVYFPAIAKAENKKAIAKKIEKIFPVLGIGWFFLTTLTMLVGLKLYGEEYPIDYRAIILFGAYALFNLYGSLFGFITLSGGNRTVVQNLFFSWFFCVVLYFVFLGAMGVFGAITLYSVLIAYVLLFFANALLNKYFCNTYLSSL